MKGRLDKVDDLKTQVDVTHEHVAVLRDTVVTKTEEVNDLKEQIERLKEELDASRFQVSTFSSMNSGGFISLKFPVTSSL